MLKRIFPTQIHNTYRGYRLAIWLLAPIVVVKVTMGFKMLFNVRELAQAGKWMLALGFSMPGVRRCASFAYSFRIANNGADELERV